MRSRRGEQLIGRFSFGLVFFLLGLPAVLLTILGVLSGSTVVLAICVVLFIVYLILLSLIRSALAAVFQAALYLYASEGQAGDAFTADLLSGAMGRR